MSASSPPPRDLDTLIATAIDPPAGVGRGRVARLVLRVMLRVQRPLIAHRLRVDGALLHELRRTQSEAAELRDGLAETRREVAALREWLATTNARSDETAGRLGAFIDETATEILRQLASVMQRVPEAAPLDTSLERFDAGLGGDVLGYRASAGAAEAADTYVGFEDVFRGSEQQIRERLSVYVPLLAGHGPVLDVGCGRGEVLEVLRDAGIEARGIDLDPAMVRRCHEKGLDQVEVADAVGFLQSAAAGSLGAVFAGQVIEHLSYDALVSFIGAAHRALRTDGLLVMETVNPHCSQALKHFWIDPTHHHPLFPEVVLVLSRIAGFGSGFMWFPHGSGDPEHDRPREFDYAVVARRASVG